MSEWILYAYDLACLQDLKTVLMSISHNASRTNALHRSASQETHTSAHCVETALIVEALHASSRALDDIDERWSIAPFLKAY